MRHLHASEQSLVVNALRVAAELYRLDAQHPNLPERLAEQLRRQQQDAERLADEFEQSHYIEVSRRPIA